jgi:hypothetical protein
MFTAAITQSTKTSKLTKGVAIPSVVDQWRKPRFTEARIKIPDNILSGGIYQKQTIKQTDCKRSIERKTHTLENAYHPRNDLTDDIKGRYV